MYSVKIDPKKSRQIQEQYLDPQKLLPDMGVYLDEKGYTDPFMFQFTGNVIGGVDKKLGWLLTVVIGNGDYAFSRFQDKELPPILVPKMIGSIYLGRGSKTRTDKIIERLHYEGIPIVARPDEAYTTRKRDRVLPFEYLKG